MGVDTADKPIDTRGGMRTAILTASLLAVALGAWPAAAAAPAPPKCSAADTQRGVANKRGYVRFCGAARAVVRVKGKTFTFKEGRCSSTRAGFGVMVMGQSLKATRGRGFEVVLEQVRHSGRTAIIDSAFQLPGVDATQSPTSAGTAIIAKNLKSATFSVGGKSIAGSWSCAKLSPG
jgi:hypothetical protein